MFWNKILLLNLALFVNVVVPQGAPWNPEEAAIIKMKISKIFNKGGNNVIVEFHEIHPELSYDKSLAPNAAKVKFLTFDCYFL